MKRLVRAALIVIGMAGLIAALAWGWRQVAIDSCLDRGGRWSATVAACEGAAE